MTRSLVLFIYSRESNNSYEWEELKKCLDYEHDLSRIRRVAIEDINVFIDRAVFRFFVHGAEIPIDRIRTVFVVDMGLPSLANVAYRMFLLSQLNKSGARIVNSPESINTCRNKLATALCFGFAGVPAIPTLAVSDPSGIQCAMVGLKAPLIVKPISGSRGIGVQQLRTETLQTDAVNHAIRHRDIPLIQPSICKCDSADFRLLVAGDHVVASMRRYSPNVVTNIFQGGAAIPFSPSAVIQELAINASRAVHATVCTVDILEDQKRNLFVLEVNAFARWKGLQTVTEFSIAGVLARFVMDL